MSAARVLGVLEELLLLDSRRSLPAWRLGVYVAAIIAITLWIVPGVVTARIPFSSDGHAIASYDVALTRAVCGLPSRYNPIYHPSTFMSKNDWASDLSAPDLLKAVAGSVETYCSTATIPYVNEDHTVGLMETAYLFVRPTASAVEIGRFLATLRVLMVVVFVAILLALGASVVFAGAVAIAAVAIGAHLQQTGFVYSTNPFFAVMVLLNAGAFYLALSFAGRPSRWPGLFATAAVGTVVAASVNMRSSYLPVFASFFLIYSVAAWHVRSGMPGRWLWAVWLLPSFLFGYFSFHYPLIIRPAQVAATSNYTYHTVSHPLVLGLALPENELSKREGILWLDEVGNSLARRIDPTTSYLLPGYEKAMFTYYRRLWERYPREMLGIYYEKLQIAGADMIHYRYYTEKWMPAAMWPLTGIDKGLYFFALLAGLAAASFAWFWKSRVGIAFCVTLLAVAGALLYLESAVIVPFYYPHYHSYLLFVGLLVSFIAYQFALNAAAAAVTHAMRALRPTPDSTVANHG